MDYKYTRYGLSEKERRLERFLEIIPGGLSWLILIGMTILSFTHPFLASIIIIAFLLHWFLLMMYMNIMLLLSYARFRVEKNTDWMKRAKEADALDFAGNDKAFQKKDDNNISGRIHRMHLRKLLKSNGPPPKLKDIFHVVIIPVARESQDVVEPGIAAIKNSTFPAKKILMVIALEQRAGEIIQKQMNDLSEKYKEAFFDFFVILHPSDLPGEARVKGANTTFAAKKVAAYLDEKGIAYENTIISCFDADTVAVPDYFSCLTYYFMITPTRLRSSFQPVPVYFNNIWEVPAFGRVLDVGTSFFQLVEFTDPEKLVTFSSHSMSFKALVEIDYWSTDIISDDSSIFWKAFLHYEGQYQTVPMPITVSMDVITGSNFTETIKNIYKQKRRWAWGVENFPIIVRGFMQSKKIALSRKLAHTSRMIYKLTSWGSWSFLLSFISWLPILASSKEFASTTVYYLAPRIRFIIFTLAFLGVLTCMFTSMMLLPVEKTRHPVLKKLYHCGEWLFIPVVVLLLSAVPALDAQTRLMFGKYMEFWVAEKYRPHGQLSNT